MQKELEDYFHQFGEISSVRMRRKDGQGRPFKGSVFVEFAKMDDLQKFLALDPKPQWKDGTELETMTK